MSFSITAHITMERKALDRAAAKAMRRALSRAGAYIRGMAMRSIKIDPLPSDPGSPPHSRKGQLKRSIGFNVEGGDGVVIGPQASWIAGIGHTQEFGGRETKTFKRRSGNPGPMSPGEKRIGDLIPIEYQGGRLRVTRMRSQKQLARARGIAARYFQAHPAKGNVFGQATRTSEYPARPFMEPTLARSKDRIPDFWKASING